MRRVKLFLDDPHMKWHTAAPRAPNGPAVWGRGWAFVDDQLVEGQGLVDRFAEALGSSEARDGFEAARRLAAATSGNWVFIAQWPTGYTVAVTDRARSIPIFYAATDTEYLLAWSALDIRRYTKNWQVNEEAALEYLLCPCVTGDETLYQGIYQILPGEIAEFDVEKGGDKPRIARYYRYLPECYSLASETDLAKELEDILEAMFAPLVKAAGDQRILVPLSGGFDSRLVSAMLKRQGARNVLCYCYGKPGGAEPSVSKRVAEALGFPWHFIEYNGEVWRRWMAAPEMRQFWWYTSRGASLVHIQDIPAVMSLSQGGQMTPGDIFFPGHSGDMMAGGDLPSKEILDRATATEDGIFELYYFMWPTKGLPDVQARMKKRIARVITPAAHYNVYAQHEYWNAENKQAKYVINSVRPYEFVDGRWRTFWTHRVIDFVLKLPIAHKLHRRLWLSALRSRIFRGPAAALADMPATSGTWWTATGQIAPVPTPVSTVVSTVKSAAKAVLDKVGAIDKARALWHRQTREMPMLFQWWFSGGRNPKELKLIDAMRPYGTLDKLPKNVLPVVAPHLKTRLDLVFPQAVLAAISLGELVSPEAGS